MGMQIVFDYKDQPVTYDVTAQEKDIYRLCLNEPFNSNTSGTYIPGKINIRRKGKLWISDLENYRDLVALLLLELMRFQPGDKKSHHKEICVAVHAGLVPTRGSSGKIPKAIRRY